MQTRKMPKGMLTTATSLVAALALTLVAGSTPSLSDPGVITDDATLYVDIDASTGGDGQSWDTAYRHVQDALDEANANGSTSYEIWVAEGVYHPDQDGDGDHADNDESESFTLSSDNVQLYGGFAGGEAAREERDWQANVTVLSGDIDGNDATDAHGVVIDPEDINGNNAYHVVLLDGETNEPITGATVIDGFTITAGQADGDGSDGRGGGVICVGRGRDVACSPTLSHVALSGNVAGSGGAMVNDGTAGGNSSPTLTHVVFSNNSATGDGGALFNHGDGGISSPTLTDVTFSANSAGGDGGAMLNVGQSFGTSSPTLTDVTFSANSAGGDGGAMLNFGRPTGTSSPTLIDVTFSANAAGGDGGAMLNLGEEGGASSPTLTNVTFADNDAVDRGGAMANSGRFSGFSSPVLTNVVFSGNSADFGGAMDNDGESGTSSPTLTNVTFNRNSAGQGGAILSSGGGAENSPTLTNVILWGNTAMEGGAQMYNDGATPAIGHSLVEGGWDGPGIYNDDTSVTNNGGNIEGNPQFVDAEGGDLRLEISSPAIDAGNNSAVPTAVTTDRDGDPRFVDIPGIEDTGSGTPPIVDVGAYEVQGEAVPDLTISKSATPQVSAELEGTITYTVTLENVGTASDPNVHLTDTLPSGVIFRAWIERPPDATIEDELMTWAGAVPSGETVRLVFLARYDLDGYGAVVINAAAFEGTLETGRAEASFTTAFQVYLPLVEGGAMTPGRTRGRQ